MVYTIYNWLGFLVQKGVYRFFGPIFISWRIKLIFGGRTCFDPRGGGELPYETDRDARRLT